MKMMHGEASFACSNRSHTRDAPTPTNISTKSEPEMEKNGTPAPTFPVTLYVGRLGLVPALALRLLARAMDGRLLAGVQVELYGVRRRIDGLLALGHRVHLSQRLKSGELRGVVADREQRLAI